MLPVQPGDCVIINAANSIVGRTLLQLCKLLKLRCVAVVRCSGSTGPKAAQADAAGGDGGGSGASKFAATAEELKVLGATLVLKDEGSVKVCLCVCAMCVWREVVKGMLMSPACREACMLVTS